MGRGDGDHARLRGHVSGDPDRQTTGDSVCLQWYSCHRFPDANHGREGQYFTINACLTRASSSVKVI